jgi:ABC-type multidrug transport system permease subunit
MTVAVSYADAALATVKRDLLTFFSYRLQFVTRALNLIFSATLFYYISRLVRFEGFGGADDYFAFVVVGLVILQVINACVGAPALLRQQLVAGTFERVVVSPLGARVGILASLAFPFLLTLVSSMLIVSFAGAAFGMPIRWSTIVLALPVVVLAAAAFTGFGLLMTAALIVFKQAPGITWLIAGISLIAGLYFPVELLPDWIGWASGVQPFTPSVDLLRHVVIGAPVDGSPWVLAAKVAGFAVVLLPGSLLVLSHALELSRRRGTLLEY